MTGPEAGTPAAEPPPPPRPRARTRAVDRLRSHPATGALILLTALVFLGQSLSGAFLGIDLVLSFGAKINEAILAGEFWRFVTPVFIHVGLAHVLVNMYSLYVIGPAVEGPFGSRRLLLVYLLSGVSGVAASLALSPQPSAGASGAVFGLLGAYAGFLFHHRSLLGRAGAGQLRHIVLVAMANLLIGLSPGIDNWGHVGGLAFGIGLSLFLGPRFQLNWVEGDNSSLTDMMPPTSITSRALLSLAFCLGWAAIATRLAAFR